MKWKITSWALVFSLITQLLAAQTVEETYAAARHSFANADYNSAISFYERVLFFDHQKATADDYLNLSDAYAFEHNLRMSFNVTKRAAVTFRQNDSILNEIFFKNAKLSILEDNHEQAKYWIFQVDSAYSEAQFKQLQIIEGMSYFLAGDFESANQSFTKLLEVVKFNQEEYNALFKTARRAQRKKPYLALFMSLIIPGTGQAYAGEWGEAANSFLLNAVFIAIYVNVLFTYSFLEAFTLVYPWFLRYYSGGYNRAMDLVIQKKKQKKYSSAVELLELLDH